MILKRFVPAIGWLALVTWLLCLPGSTIPKSPWLAKIYADKWVHVFLFGTLCLLFSYPMRKSVQRQSYFLFVTLCGIAYGVMMEFVQKYWIPNRSFELLDIAADTTGCLITLFYARKKFGARK